MNTYRIAVKDLQEGDEGPRIGIVESVTATGEGVHVVATWVEATVDPRTPVTVFA
jgi:hypothetical protein